MQMLHRTFRVVLDGRYIDVYYILCILTFYHRHLQRYTKKNLQGIDETR